MTSHLKFGVLFVAALVAAAPSTASGAGTKTTAKAHSTARVPFATFFAAFRQAVLANDRQKVADMVILPFTDFSDVGPTRSASTRTQFLARYDRIFTPAVIAGIKGNRYRGFRSGPEGDEGEMEGPIAEGEYLLDIEWRDQIVFGPKGRSWGMSRIPFYA